MADTGNGKIGGNVSPRGQQVDDSCRPKGSAYQKWHVRYVDKFEKRSRRSTAIHTSDNLIFLLLLKGEITARANRVLVQDNWPCINVYNFYEFIVVKIIIKKKFRYKNIKLK